MNLRTNATTLNGESLPLHRHYPGQASPQRAYVEIDPADGSATASWDAVVGEAVPATVFHGRVIRLPVSPLVWGDAIADWLNEHTEAIKDVINGHSVNEEGHGDLSEEAHRTLLGLEETLACLEEASVWDAADWLDGVPTEDLGMSCDTTDEEIESLAAERVEEARDDDIVLLYDNVVETLETLRSRQRGSCGCSMRRGRAQHE